MNQAMRDAEDRKTSSASSLSSAKDTLAPILERLPPEAVAGLTDAQKRDLARVVNHCGWLSREHRTGRFTEKQILTDFPRRMPQRERQLKARLRELARVVDGIADFLEKEEEPELGWLRGCHVYPRPEGVTPVETPTYFREIAAAVRAMPPGSAAQIKAMCREILDESSPAAGRKAVDQKITLLLYDWFIGEGHSGREAEVRTGLIGNAIFRWEVRVVLNDTPTETKGCETVRSRVRRRDELPPVNPA